jgi:phage host-nuclease inhibitor protein Gam
VSEVADAISETEARTQLEGLMRGLHETVLERDRRVNERSLAIKAINDEHSPEIERLDREIAVLTGEIQAAVRPNFWTLVKKGTKTIFLHYGEISHHKSAASLEVSNEEELIAWLRRHRLLGKTTKVGKRTVRKKDLTQLLSKDKGLASKVRGARLVQNENLIIKPGKTAAEITLSLSAGDLNANQED